MRIGLLVDGRGEYHGLREIRQRLSPHPIVEVLLCDLQPKSTPAQMALAASKKAPILELRTVDAIVLLVDKEDRSECTGELAAAIQSAASSRLKSLGIGVPVHVVLKVSKLENWLVADPQALRELAGLFDDVDRIERQVAGGRADSVDASALLRGCARRGNFEKVRETLAICRKLDPARAATNSRSFRKFLKVLEHPAGLPAPKPRRRG
jgi:Domain of unknown function (DUF4276)